MIPPSHLSRVRGNSKVDRKTPRTIEEAFGDSYDPFIDEPRITYDTSGDKLVIWTCGILALLALGMLIAGVI
jgi:hypothetical protein